MLEKDCRKSDNNRNVMEAGLWKLRTGAPWRDAPDNFCPWKTACNRFNRWAKKDLWKHFRSIATRFERSAKKRGGGSRTKTVLFFSSLLLMPCVTAGPNTELSLSADYSESDSDEMAGLWDFLFGPYLEKERAHRKERQERQRRKDLSECFMDCRCALVDGHLDSFRQEKDCKRRCRTNYANSPPPGLSLATASVEDPFKLLEEMPFYDFYGKTGSVDVEPENKAPLMMAGGYEDCMDDCLCNRGSSTHGCHLECE